MDLTVDLLTMKINLITIGKNMPDWVSVGYAEYAKRLPAAWQLQLVEISMPKRGKNDDIQRLIAEEGEKMLAAIPEGSLVVALDEHGNMWRTLDFAKQLQNWHETYSSISLLVGGPDGLAQSCKKRASVVWSLSPLTFPHPIVRVVVAEQIYRAWSVLQGHPYHRE